MKPAMHEPVAIIGMSARLPGATDLQEFWDNLCAGRDAMAEVPGDRWDWRDYHGPADESGEHSYVNRAGFTPHVDCFDARLFALNPKEVRSMDPQQRLFLQSAWSTFEDAAYAPSALAGRPVGVFVGVGNADYPVLLRRDAQPIDAYRATGMALTVIANRVSYALDLRGPSESIDTACSSSLVAIHRAMAALRDGECEMALAGGVNLLLGPELFVAFSQAGMLSRSGHCRTFDAGADGYMRGEGIGSLLLKPLSAAERDGDFIYALLRGSAENHGGRAHSLTAPNAQAQAEVIQRAWQRAGLGRERIDWLETHGTGTALGDPIEINGIKTAYAAMQETTPRSRPLWLGALKSHIGHLEAAAGIAGVLKTVLCLQQRRLPGNLHYQACNPHIDLTDTPLKIAEKNQPLGEADEPLAAGVSSFGFGGVNAHVVLESYPAKAPENGASRAELVLLSAHSEDALKARAKQLLGYLQSDTAGRQAMTAHLLVVLNRVMSVHKAAPQADTESSLHDLGVTLRDFRRLIDQLSDDLSCPLAAEQLRDCLSIGELAERLWQICPTPAKTTDNDHLLPRVCLSVAQRDQARLCDIAYSLQTGRDPMKERLACVVSSRAELITILEAFIHDETSPENTLRGTALKKRKSRASQSAGQAEAALPETYCQAGARQSALIALARYWVKTARFHIDWNTLYEDGPQPRRVPLPSYPFLLQRAWYCEAPAPRADIAVLPDAAQPAPEPLARLPQTVCQADLQGADDWRSLRHQQQALPDSCLALGWWLPLARQLCDLGPQQALQAYALRLGPPVTVDSGLCAEAVSARDLSLQIALDDPCAHILMQGEAQALTGPLRHLTQASPSALQALPLAEFCAALQQQGWQCGRLSQSGAQLNRVGDGLWIELAQTVDLAAPMAAQQALFSWLITAVHYLAPSPELRLPSAVERLQIAAGGRISRLQISRHSSRWQLVGLAADGSPLLQLQGVSLRNAPPNLTARSHFSGDCDVG